MENNKDKPYSLQDAKDEVAIKYGFSEWANIMQRRGNIPDTFYKEAAELYASKATEELRKERDELKSVIADDMRSIKNYISEIERIKESNRQLEVNQPGKKKLSTMSEPIKKPKTLREIQDEVAKEMTPHKWDGLQPSIIQTMNLWPEVCRRAQLECARETLKEASKNVKLKKLIIWDQIDESSITDEGNIKLIN